MKLLYTMVLVAAASLNSARADAPLVRSPRGVEKSRESIVNKGYPERQAFHFKRSKPPFADKQAGTNAATDRNLVSEQRRRIYTGKNPRRDFRVVPEAQPAK